MNPVKSIFNRYAVAFVKWAGAKVGLYVYDFPQASPCGAVLIYSVDDTHVHMLTTKRAQKMGGKRSLSAGGFYEVIEMLPMKDGEFRDGRIDIYREMIEELGEEMKDIIPEDVFLKNASYICDLMIRGHGNTVRHATTHGLQVSKDVLDKILQLSNTEEQVGKVIETLPLSADKTPQETIAERLHDFQYNEEVFAAKRWYANLVKK